LAALNQVSLCGKKEEVKEGEEVEEAEEQEAEKPTV